MKRHSVVIMSLFLFLYILPLGFRPLIFPDETRYAEIPREMIASGDWIVPHLNGLRYFEKPVLGYWMNAASMMLFGENAFAARFPSALAAGISAWMIFLLVKRFFGRGGMHAAGLSGVVFLTFPMVMAVGTFSVLDSMFAMFVTSAMTMFFFGYMESRPGKRTVFFVLFGMCCGLAFLTKGFIGFVVPATVIVPYMIWDGRLSKFEDVFKPSIVSALLIVLPWALIIHLREPDFWRYFVCVEHLQRFMSDHAQHPFPFWYFVPVLAGGAAQWLFLIPAVGAGLKSTRLKDPVLRFSVCWFLFPFLFFSLSRGKLGTYILPCFPPLAILIAAGIQKYFSDQHVRAYKIGVWILASVMAFAAAALVWVQTTGFSGLAPYSASETWKWILGAFAILTWSFFSILSGITPGALKKQSLFLVGPVLCMFCSQFIWPNQILSKIAPGEFLMRNANRVGPEAVLLTDRLTTPACWFYKRNDVFLFISKGELEYGIGYDDAASRYLTGHNIRKFFEKMGDRPIILVVQSKRYDRFKSLLPTPVFEDNNGKLVFVEFGSTETRAEALKE
jgi:4-amino-4-deoxy-L-arabinose transferase